MKGWLFVLAQFALLLALLFTGPWLASAPAWLIVEATGVGIGLWAVFAMRRSPLNLAPNVRAGARLVTDGPYQWIRHPMYTALLLATGALVGAAFSWARLVLWLGLLAVLVGKLRYEESLLAAHFPAYEHYQQQTKRLVPFLF